MDQTEDFELLCLDGSRRSIGGYRDCNWGQIPSDAVATTSAKSIETRLKYQAFLGKLVEMFGSRTANPRPSDFRNATIRPSGAFSPNIIDSKPLPNTPFKLFQSAPRYGMLSNLIFQDDSVSLKVIAGPQQQATDHAAISLHKTPC